PGAPARPGVSIRPALGLPLSPPRLTWDGRAPGKCPTSGADVQGGARRPAHHAMTTGIGRPEMALWTWATAPRCEYIGLSKVSFPRVGRAAVRQSPRFLLLRLQPAPADSWNETYGRSAARPLGEAARSVLVRHFDHH